MMKKEELFEYSDLSKYVPVTKGVKRVVTDNYATGPVTSTFSLYDYDYSERMRREHAALKSDIFAVKRAGTKILLFFNLLKLILGKKI